MIGDRLATVVPVALLGALVALTFWLDRIAQPAARSPAGSRNDPDYIVDNLAAVSMGGTGTAKHLLSAAKMAHYSADDTTLLTRPKFVSYGSPKSPLTITASEAIVSANGEHVYFQDDVRVTRAANATDSELVVRTAFLHVIPDYNIAKTDRTVTITNDAVSVTAVGLELNNETRVIKLLSKVRGTYEPSKHPSRRVGR